MSAYKLIKTDDGFDTNELWRNPENSLQFNDPILSNGFVYGISQRNELFSINAETGDTAWILQVGPAPASGAGQQGGGGGRANRGDRQQNPQGAPGDVRRGGGGQGQEGGQRGRRRPGGGSGQGGAGPSGFGSIVNAGSVLFVLTPTSELIVIKPGAEKSTELARYKVSESPTYAYPVVAGNRIFIKDQNSVNLYMVNQKE
jgi:hypothetical protein